MTTRKGLATMSNVKQEADDRIRRIDLYMAGFHVSLKNPGEQAYCEARSKQKARGISRAKGMSFSYGVDKSRVPHLEIVIDKVFRKALEVVG